MKYRLAATNICCVPVAAQARHPPTLPPADSHQTTPLHQVVFWAVPVFVSWGSQNRAPQTKWLKITWVYCLRVWKLKKSTIKESAEPMHLRRLYGRILPISSRSGGSRASLACGCSTLVSAPSSHGLLPVCLCPPGRLHTGTMLLD